MNLIYEPKGRAREYSPLACNLYRGCTHGCRYCYAPGCMRTTSAKWHEGAVARSRVLELFEKDAAKLRGDPRKILFSFLSDPYQPLEATEKIFFMKSPRSPRPLRLNPRIPTQPGKSTAERTKSAEGKQKFILRTPFQTSNHWKARQKTLECGYKELATRPWSSNTQTAVFST